MRKLISRHENEKQLHDAYKSKLNIVENTLTIIQTPTRMNALYAAADSILMELETYLLSGPFNEKGWLASEKFSMADITWGVVLYRLQKLGLESLLWGNRTTVGQYCEKLFTRESFKTGIMDWNNIPQNIVFPMIKYKLFNRNKLVG